MTRALPPTPHRWVKSLEAGAGLRTVAAGSPALPAALEAAVRAGLPLLVEGVSEGLDPLLEPLLARATYKHGARSARSAQPLPRATLRPLALPALARWRVRLLLEGLASPRRPPPQARARSSAWATPRWTTTPSSGAPLALLGPHLGWSTHAAMRPAWAQRPRRVAPPGHTRPPTAPPPIPRRLYLATRLPNPHFLPGAVAKVNLVNFAVTRKARRCGVWGGTLGAAAEAVAPVSVPADTPMSNPGSSCNRSVPFYLTHSKPSPSPQGLEDQLLAELLQRDRPELEAARDRLVVAIAGDTRQLQARGDARALAPSLRHCVLPAPACGTLSSDETWVCGAHTRPRAQELEGRVLRLLRDASGHLLDDEALVATLNSARATSGAQGGHCCGGWFWEGGAHLAARFPRAWPWRRLTPPPPAASRRRGPRARGGGD